MAIDNREVTRKDGFHVPINIRGLNFTNPDGSLPDLNQQLGVVFIARHPVEVMWVSEIHTNGGTGTIMLENTGSDVLVSAFDVSGANDTVQTKQRTALQNRVLKEGEYLKLTGSGLTDTQNLNITIYLKYSERGDYR
jgi:hypothetical protein